MSNILSGKTLVITRPLHQAIPLAQQIQNWGGRTILFPTLEIKSILPASDGRELQYDFGIFVSANAVRCAQPLFNSNWALTNIAIGPGTAKALQDLHMQVDWVPSVHQSEGILALAILQEIAGKKFLIFCGENSRPLLKNSLMRRGAAVDELICYRRQCPQINGTNALKQWRHEGIDLIISTSLESLENLWRIFGGIDNEWLWNVCLLVISPAMQICAQNLGFRAVFLADGASNSAVCQALNQIYADGQFPVTGH